jgi:hypothetical protein
MHFTGIVLISASPIKTETVLFSARVKTFMHSIYILKQKDSVGVKTVGWLGREETEHWRQVAPRGE